VQVSVFAVGNHDQFCVLAQRQPTIGNTLVVCQLYYPYCSTIGRKKIENTQNLCLKGLKFHT
jgi:hypothetical protein